MIAVSLCVTNMGRLHHLKQTMDRNLRDNPGPGVEFVLLDYSSPDGMEDWVKDYLWAEMGEGRVTYYRIDGLPYYNSPHAKNLAHRLGRGRILCNLDADNYTGPAFAARLQEIFLGRSRLVARGIYIKNVSLGGRIAILREDFLALGGYDERLGDSWGYDDDDLHVRAKAMGFGTVELGEEHSRHIPHGSADRMKHMLAPVDEQQPRRAAHKRLSDEAVRAGRLVANQGLRWGAGRVTRNFCETMDVP